MIHKPDPVVCVIVQPRDGISVGSGKEPVASDSIGAKAFSASAKDGISLGA